MLRSRFNKLATKLGEDLLVGATSVTFETPLQMDGVSFPTLPAGFFVPLAIDSEIVYLTEYVEDALTGTIVRAQESTTESEHLTRTDVLNAPSAFELDRVYASGSSTNLTTAFKAAALIGSTALLPGVECYYLSGGTYTLVNALTFMRTDGGISIPTALPADTTFVLRLTRYHSASTELHYSAEYPFAAGSGNIADLYVNGVLEDSILAAETESTDHVVNLPRGPVVIELHATRLNQKFLNIYLTPVDDLTDEFFIDEDGVHLPSGGLDIGRNSGSVAVGKVDEIAPISGKSNVLIGMNVGVTTYPDGLYASPSEYSSVAIGSNARVRNGSIAIGDQVQASDSSIVIGANFDSNSSYDIVLGSKNVILPIISDATTSLEAVTGSVTSGTYSASGFPAGTYYLVLVAKKKATGQSVGHWINWVDKSVVLASISTISVTVNRVDDGANEEVDEYEVWMRGTGDASNLFYLTHRISSDGSVSYSAEISGPSAVLASVETVNESVFSADKANANSTGLASYGANIVVGNEVWNDVVSETLSIGMYGWSESSTQSVSLGYRGGMYNADQSIGIGVEHEVKGQYNTVLGQYATADGFYDITGAVAAITGAHKSIAIGYGAYTEGPEASSVGPDTFSYAKKSTAIGSGSSSSQNNDLALGQGAVSNGIGLLALTGGSTAIGSGASATKSASLSVGENATSTGFYSIALGASATSSGESSAALGYSSIANGTSAMAIGKNAQSDSDEALAIGTGALALSSSSTALGAGATADTTLESVIGPALAVGVGASALHTRSVAIGHGAETTERNQVVLGTVKDVVALPGARGADKAAMELLADGAGIVLRSPDGTKFLLTVTNAGAVDVANIDTTAAPDAPTGVAATALWQRAMSVEFTPPAVDNHAPVVEYIVTSSPGGITATGAESPITVEGLTPDTSYTFTVQAVNAAGTSSASDASAAVSTPAAAVPEPPSNAVVTTQYGSGWEFSFSVPRDNGSALTTYTATFDPAVAPPLTWNAASNSFIITGWDPGTCSIEIVATNSIGDSAPYSFTIEQEDWR